MKDEYVILRVPEGSGNLEAGTADLEVQDAVLTPAERNDLQRDPRTRAIAPNMPWKLIRPTATREVDAAALSAATWGVEAVRAPSSPFDGSGITVAVLDTGIDLSHPAFAGVNVETRNFTTESDDDLDGHGTHCAGTIFGQDVDGMRIGIARNIERALIGKVIGEGGTTLAVVNGINWAVNEGAHVISMSLGIDFPGLVDELINIHGFDARPATSFALEAYRHNVSLFADLHQFTLSRGAFGGGTVFIAASGNESDRPNYEIAASPPAVASGFIAVGALARGANGFSIASFSNSQVQLAAPGVDVISAALGGGVVSMDGTSMATPHVAGVAALWAQRQFEMSNRVLPRTLEADLIASGVRTLLDPAEVAENVGTGIVQAPRN